MVHSIMNGLVLYKLNFIGMLSKSKRQVLRVSTVMHVLFHTDTPTTIPREISEAAVGRGDFQEAINDIQQGSF